MHAAVMINKETLLAYHDNGSFLMNIASSNSIADLDKYQKRSISLMRTSEDRSGLLVTCTGNTGRSPVLTGERVPVD